MRLALISAVSLTVIAACETVPPPPPPTPDVMTESLFQTELASAKAYQNPYQAAQRISALLARDDLSQDMRVRALYERGSLRRQGADDRRGAVEDFDALLRLSPNHAVASNARIERSYAQREISEIEQFRRTGRLQTLAQWFDDAWRLGAHEKAAARYQRAGLSPTSDQLQKLVQAGYVCKGSGTGGKVHKYGPLRSDLQTANWCRPMTNRAAG